MELHEDKVYIDLKRNGIDCQAEMVVRYSLNKYGEVNSDYEILSQTPTENYSPEIDLWIREEFTPDDDAIFEALQGAN